MNPENPLPKIGSPEFAQAEQEARDREIYLIENQFLPDAKAQGNLELQLELQARLNALKQHVNNPIAPAEQLPQEVSPENIFEHMPPEKALVLRALISTTPKLQTLYDRIKNSFTRSNAKDVPRKKMYLELYNLLRRGNSDDEALAAEMLHDPKPIAISSNNVHIIGSVIRNNPTLTQIYQRSHDAIVQLKKEKDTLTYVGKYPAITKKEIAQAVLDELHNAKAPESELVRQALLWHLDFKISRTTKS